MCYRQKWLLICSAIFSRCIQIFSFLATVILKHLQNIKENDAMVFYFWFEHVLSNPLSIWCLYKFLSACVLIIVACHVCSHFHNSFHSWWYIFFKNAQQLLIWAPVLKSENLFTNSLVASDIFIVIDLSGKRAPLLFFIKRCLILQEVW